MSTQTWTWHLSEQHWIELTLAPAGLSYLGTDWGCQSGGDYSAGFQSRDRFLEDGPLNQMPDDIARAVRHAIEAGGPRHSLRVSLAGPTPLEVHLAIQGHSHIARDTSEIICGQLVPGRYTVSGVAFYDGVDDKGRRLARRFEATIEVDGPTEVVIDNLSPRFDD